MFLFAVYGIDKILTWTLRPRMSKPGFYSQSNVVEQPKFLRQPQTDGYQIMHYYPFVICEKSLG